MLGAVKPITPALVGTTAGIIYASLLETHQNFTTFVIEPGTDFMLGIAQFTVYNFGAFMLTTALIFVTFVAFINAVVSWNRKEPISLWR